MKTVLDFLVDDMFLCGWSKDLFFTFLNFTLLLVQASCF